MQRQQDSRPLQPTTMSLVFGDTSEHSSPSIAKLRPATTDIALITESAVGNIIQNAQMTIKAQRLR